MLAPVVRGQPRVRILFCLACGLLLAIHFFSQPSTRRSRYGVETEGSPRTPDFIAWITRDGERVSPWHDVSLREPGAPEHIVNFVNEIPRGTRAKFETQTKVPGNPIVQDSKDGVLREYTYGATFFNYGALPQTWEDPRAIDAATGAGGDGDPLDAIELSPDALPFGEVLSVRVLGALAMIDQGEVDWKLIVVAVDAPHAKRWNTLADVPAERMLALRDWLINYKTTDGKPPNQVLDTAYEPAAALAVVRETHEQWARLRRGVAAPGKLWTGVDTASQKVSIRSILSAGSELLAIAGAEIGAVHSAAALDTKTKGKASAAFDPLTRADIASHRLLTENLVSLWPELSLVSEEDDQRESEVPVPQLDAPPSLSLFDDLLPELLVPSVDVTVWIDPLDATKEFTEGMLEYVTTMLCVAVRGEPVAGIIFQAFAEDTTDRPHVAHAVAGTHRLAWGVSDLVSERKWTGGLAGGAAKAEVSAAPAHPQVIVSLSHPGALVEPLAALGGTKRGAAGAGYKALAVADGEADVYLHRTKIKKWDVCAGDALLRAMGGGIVDWAGKPLVYFPDRSAVVAKNGLLAATDSAALRDYVQRLAGISAQAD